MTNKHYSHGKAEKDEGIRKERLQRLKHVWTLSGSMVTIVNPRG